MARTQRAVLDQIDRQSRRALDTGAQADVSALLRMYSEALRDLESIVRSTWAEMQGDPDAERRRYLAWKLGREQAFRDQVARRLDALRTAWTQSLRDGLLRQYVGQSLWDAYAIDQATPPRITVNTRTTTPTAADAVVNTPWRGAMFSDYVWAMTDDMTREIQNQIGQAMLSGESVSDAVRRIKQVKVADGNVPPDYAIERLARTEMLKASDRARQLLYAENSDVVSAEEIVVALDQRTCEICGPLDGERLGSKSVDAHLDSHDAEERPPFHPNCRCTTAPKLVSWKDLLGLEAEGLDEFADEERVIRDPLTGKSRLAPTMDFAEWQQFARGTALGVALAAR